jgi:hypothetical protein
MPGAYNLGVYNGGIYNLGISVDVSLEFNGVGEYLANQLLHQIGIENNWTVNIWFKPFETVSRFDSAGLPLFKPDGKALLHLKGASHRNELLIWGDRIEDSVTQEFVVVENWSNAAQRIQVTRFNLAQKRNEWRMFTCTWDGQDIKGYGGGLELTDTHVLYTGTGGAVMEDLTGGSSGTGREVYLAVHNSGIAQSLDDPYLVAYSGLMGPVTVWNTALGSVELGQVVSGTFGFEPATNSGTYTSSANLKHYWRLGASEDDIGFDYVAAGEINVSINATITGGNIVSDAP